VLAATVVLAMAEGFGPLLPASVLAPYVAAAGLLAAECVALSFAQYGYFFVRTLRMAPRR
jgi:cardiolipin synthase